MGPVAISFAVACTVVLGLTFFGAMVRTKGLHPFGAAAFLFVMFWVSRGVSDQVGGPPWSMLHYPVQDVILLAMVWHVWGEGRALWKPAVAILLLLELGFHASYWGAWLNGDYSLATLRHYIFLNNAAFAGVLFALGFAGVDNVARGLGLFGRGGVPSAGSVDHLPRPVQ